MGKLTTIVSALLLASNALAAIDPIVVKGTKFYHSNGDQFFMKGIAYQQDTAAAGGETTSDTFADPLADEAACIRDVPILQKANTNTIRTYAIDPTADHSACMKLLQDAGIYVISDLGEPRLSVNRDNPQWNLALFERYKAVVDELAQYDNVIGFFAGNEVSNNRSNTEASAFVKAAVRDTKAHIKAKGYRWMGVGYAANDDADIRINSAHYFNCGDQESAIDFWGYNIYSWCGENTFEGSGYKTQVDFFANYSVPVFLAEYGCNTVGGAEGRLFQDTTALYSDDMVGVFSGGIVYMYFQEANDYGLVTLSGGQATEMENFAVLSSRVAAATPSSTASGSYTPTNSPATCPGIAETWEVSGDALPPTPDAALCECMYNTLSCVPKSDLSTEEYGRIFGYICGTDGNPCAGIDTNTATGIYGPFSMCNDTQKLGYVMNEYYKGQKKATSACDNEGAGEVVAVAGAASTCADSLASASSAASIAATATGAPTASPSEDAAGSVKFGKLFAIGDLAVGAYLVIAMGVGAGMILL